mmetsp:Transcript_13708/g.32481  ORF Transcript_13708/g.32481 Transcript_13708/m.32481 type:complete len:231 (-) Transcript_13708:482-1174(-)
MADGVHAENVSGHVTLFAVFLGRLRADGLHVLAGPGAAPAGRGRRRPSPRGSGVGVEGELAAVCLLRLLRALPPQALGLGVAALLHLGALLDLLQRRRVGHRRALPKRERERRDIAADLRPRVEALRVGHDVLVEDAEAGQAVDDLQAVVGLLAAGVPLQVELPEEMEPLQVQQHLLEVPQPVLAEIQGLQELHVAEASLEAPNLVVVSIQGLHQAQSGECGEEQQTRAC